MCSDTRGRESNAMLEPAAGRVGARAAPGLNADSHRMSEPLIGQSLEVGSQVLCHWCLRILLHHWMLVRDEMLSEAPDVRLNSTCMIGLKGKIAYLNF